MSREELDEAFARHLDEINLSGSRLACVLVAVLMPAGVLLDLLTHPRLVESFFALRIATSAVALLIWLVSLRLSPRYQSFWLGALPIFVAAGAMELMILQIGGVASSYYAGLNLCVLGVGVVFTWNIKQTAMACAVILSIWLVPGIATADTKDAAALSNNLYFLVLTSIIAIASNSLRYRLTRRELESRVALVEAKERLELAYGHQKEFLRTVSHELRTPLHSILGFTELVAEREKSISDRGREHLERVQASGRRLLRLINDILDLSRMEAGRLEIVPQAMEVAPVLQDVAEHARQLIGQRLIQVRVEVDPELWLISDASRVEQILVNLASNAVKFTELGYIRLAARRRSESVLFTVEDTGIGIPEEEQQGIFEAFRQVRGGGRVEGTGLGLSIVVKLVELMGGGIEMKSQRGEGTTFEVTLPDLQPARHPSGELVVPSMAPDKLRQEPRA